MKQGAPPIGGTPVLRALNTAHVLRRIRSAAPEPMRIADLVDSTGLARPTVAQAVGQLLTTGLIVEQPEDRETGRMGRPAQVYRLNPLAMPVLGIDVGIHSVTVAVADASGVLLALKRRPVASQQVESMSHALDVAIQEALHACGLVHANIVAITVATPGIISPTSDEVVLIPSINGWRSFNITQHLQRAFDCQIGLENDANAAAVAAATTSPELGSPLLVVHWGERVGAGIVMADGLHHGAHRTAGEIGLMDVPSSPEPGASTGRLQDVISTTAVGQRALEAAGEDPRGTLAALLVEASPQDRAGVLFAAASQKDRVAMSVVASLVTTFCRAIAPVVLALDPQCVIISGGITHAGSILSVAIEQELAGMVVTRCPVHLSPDSENTVVMGAVHLALQAAWRSDDSSPAQPTLGHD